MSKKHTFEYVKQYFREQGCELLEKIYKNSLTKMRYICSCKNISEIRFDNFKKGHRCNKCGAVCRSNKTRISYENVCDYFQKQGCKLLEKTYRNNNILMKYRCICGNVGKIRFRDFKNGQRCCECGNKKIGEKTRYSFRYIYDYFKDNNCELLEKEYVDSSVKIKYRCSCGDISFIRFSNFKSGQRCKKCGIEKNSGENNHNYNPKLTDEDRTDRRLIPGYNEWIKSVYKKDNWSCQKCSKIGLKLNAHHIEGYAENKE